MSDNIARIEEVRRGQEYENLSLVYFSLDPMIPIVASLNPPIVPDGEAEGLCHRRQLGAQLLEPLMVLVRIG